jgi:hypothetical protein
MFPLCATVMTLSCLGPGATIEGPTGLTPHAVGRFGVVAERGPGGTRIEPLAELRLGLTWRHQLDNGIGMAVTLEVEASHLAPRLRPW